MMGRGPPVGLREASFSKAFRAASVEPAKDSDPVSVRVLMQTRTLKPSSLSGSVQIDVSTIPKSKLNVT